MLHVLYELILSIVIVTYKLSFSFYFQLKIYHQIQFKAFFTLGLIYQLKENVSFHAKMY